MPINQGRRAWDLVSPQAADVRAALDNPEHKREGHETRALHMAVSKPMAMP